MSNSQRARALGTSARIKTYTTAERRQHAIAAFRAYGSKRLPSLTEVERTEPALLDRQVTKRTILSVMVTAFNKAGDHVQGTVGGVRQKLGLSVDETNTAFCYCVNGADMSGDEAADRLEALGPAS